MGVRREARMLEQAERDRQAATAFFGALLAPFAAAERPVKREQGK